MSHGPTKLRIGVLLASAAFALAIPAADAQRNISAKTVTRTWSVRWPARAHSSVAAVRQFAAPNGGVTSGRIYVNGFAVDSSFLRPLDYIIACAHRDPAFASGTLHQATGRIYALVVLTTGGCTPGPSVAGTLAHVKVVVRYRPY